MPRSSYAGLERELAKTRDRPSIHTHTKAPLLPRGTSRKNRGRRPWVVSAYERRADRLHRAEKRLQVAVCASNRRAIGPCGASRISSNGARQDTRAARKGVPQIHCFSEPSLDRLREREIQRRRGFCNEIVLIIPSQRSHRTMQRGYVSVSGESEKPVM